MMLVSCGALAGVLGCVSVPALAVTKGLADGRVFEMVTPVDNHNAGVLVPKALSATESLDEGTTTQLPFQVAANGSAVSYQADPTVGGLGFSANGRGDQYLARLGPEGGWSQVNIQPAARNATVYQGFTSSLATGLLVSGKEGQPRLAPLAVQAPGEGFAVLYACVFGEGACAVGEAGEAPVADPYVPLFGRPPYRAVGEFGTPHVFSGGKSEVSPVFAGSSEAGDLLFEADDSLLAGEGALEKELSEDVRGEVSDYLYDSVGGRLVLVDVTPGGGVAPAATFGAPPFGGVSFNPPDFSGVISADGSRVYWTELAPGAFENEIFLRENPGQPQSPLGPGDECLISADACTVPVSAGAARYWASADDGRYAFYTEAGGLYRFDATDGARVALAGTGASVIGVVGASAAGEGVYFVAEGVLGTGVSGEGVAALADEPNLYLSHDGEEPVFVATLSRGDGTTMEPFLSSLSSAQTEHEYGDWQPGLGQRTAAVSAGGQSVVFMSSASLAAVGFPGGVPNPAHLSEVYVYDAAANRVFCVSCAPGGEAPVSSQGEAAAFLPISWSDTYLPRWVSEDGSRVFFDSDVALVPADTNDKQDAYEWEREGSPGCPSGTGVNGGCVSLLSGGTSANDSWFVGASTDGSGAFVVTRAQLTPEDQNEVFDLYDARVAGVKPLAAGACTGAGCQGLPASPPTFAIPPSVTFDGVGNLPPTSGTQPQGKATSRALTGKQKLAKALKACGRDRRKTRRETCVKLARKRYGPSAKAKAPRVKARKAGAAGALGEGKRS